MKYTQENFDRINADPDVRLAGHTSYVHDEELGYAAIFYTDGRLELWFEDRVINIDAKGAEGFLAFMEVFLTQLLDKGASYSLLYTLATASMSAEEEANLGHCCESHKILHNLIRVVFSRTRS